MERFEESGPNVDPAFVLPGSEFDKEKEKEKESEQEKESEKEQEGEKKSVGKTGGSNLVLENKILYKP